MTDAIKALDLAVELRVHFDLTVLLSRHQRSGPSRNQVLASDHAPAHAFWNSVSMSFSRRGRVTKHLLYALVMGIQSNLQVHRPLFRGKQSSLLLWT